MSVEVSVVVSKQVANTPSPKEMPEPSEKDGKEVSALEMRLSHTPTRAHRVKNEAAKRQNTFLGDTAGALIVTTFPTGLALLFTLEAMKWNSGDTQKSDRSPAYWEHDVQTLEKSQSREGL